jgi:hypothetical protein
MKVCTRCRVEKPLDRFWFDKRLERHNPRCRACVADIGKRYRQATAPMRLATNREWQRRNRDKMRAAHQRWLARNPALAAKRTAAWRAANRERALAAQRLCDRKLKDAAYTAYGGYICRCCGETLVPFLSLDHINNDGANHRRSVKRRNLYKWLKRQGYPPGFQVLCMNCNFGKARNGGLCPHAVHNDPTIWASLGLSPWGRNRRSTKQARYDQPTP